MTKKLPTSYRPTDSGVIKEIYDEDVYRIHSLPKGARILDLGAHIGCFALRLLCERDCRVFCVEPDTGSFELLTLNLIEFGPLAELSNFAISDRIGKQRMRINEDHHASSRLDESGELLVNTRTINSIFAFPNQFDVLKCDIEGAERHLLGILVPKSITRVLMEWHNYDGHIYSNWLTNQGFEVELTGGGCPQPRYDSSFAGGMLYATR